MNFLNGYLFHVVWVVGSSVFFEQVVHFVWVAKYMFIVFLYPSDIYRICSDIFFIMLYIVSCIFFLCQFCYKFVHFIKSFKGTCLFNWFSSFFYFQFLMIWSYLYFLPSACFGFILLFLQVFWGGSLDYWFEKLLFSHVFILCYKFPSEYCFCCVLQMSVCCIFIFIHLNIFLKFPFRLPLWLIGYLEVFLVSKCLATFLSFCCWCLVYSIMEVLLHFVRYVLLPGYCLSW